ncbi:MAG: nucleoside deaminase [Ignavibacteriales bacterium]
MTFSESQNNFMKVALRQAEKAFEQDEVPIGAVIVHNNKIIAKAYNQTEMLHDPTAHAEMIAITSATNYLNSKILDECDLYVTAEPCVMCAGAILLSRIRTVYFGSFEPKFGAAGSIFNILESMNYNHKPLVYSGLMDSESKYLLQEFFKKKRNNI